MTESLAAHGIDSLVDSLVDHGIDSLVDLIERILK